MANESVDAQVLHWKSKHRELLREFDTQEASWRTLEKVLRRLVTRLCIAATGHDAHLDNELTLLASAIRREAPATELSLMLEALSKAIVALPESGGTTMTAIQPMARMAGNATAVSLAPVAVPTPLPPAPPPAPEADASPALKAIFASVDALLRRLSAREATKERAQLLLSELPQAANEKELASIIDRAAELVRDCVEQLTRERVSAAALLTEVTSRLGDFARYIASDRSDFAESFAAGESLNVQVLSDVQQLSNEAQSATDLAPLRRLISARVDSISRQVQDFRERESTRFRAHSERATKLSHQVSELTQRTQALESELASERQRARIDALTGIANRAAFDERLREEIARRARGGQPVSLLYWDIDHFKSINDRYGHAAGDRVLREVANCLMSRMRSSDFIARMGGEEFVSLLMNTPGSGALKAADELRQAVAGLRMHFRGTPVTVTISCGVTEIEAGDSADATIDRADKALYRAKDSGRNACIAA